MGRGGLTAFVIVLGGLAAGCGSEEPRLKPLPRSICSEPAFARGSKPTLLVAVDLPARGRVAPSAQGMAEAVRYAFEQRGYRAGRHRLALQICDDSTAAAGQVEVARCASNGRAYASNRQVVAVVGPVHSVCAEALVPETERAGLAVISPAASGSGLTRPAAGEPFGRDPARARAFFRVIAPDEEQGKAAIALARRLGARRVLILAQADDYGLGMRRAADTAARVAGMRVLGTAYWDRAGRRARSIAREVRAARPDAVVLAGTWNEGGSQVAAALRAALGPAFPIIGSEGFMFGLPPRAARSFGRMWITAPGHRAGSLGQAGRDVIAHAGAGQAPWLGPPLAAQAAEFAIAAITASDGTRPDVLRRLRRVRLADGPVGPMRFDGFGDPVPRHVELHRIRGSSVLPAD